MLDSHPTNNGNIHTDLSKQNGLTVPSKSSREHQSSSYYRRNKIPDPTHQTLLGRQVYRSFFTTAQLESLKAYQNTGSDLSLTYRYIMSPLYTHLINYLPKSLAPNTVTLLGLLCVVIPHLVLMFYCSDLKQKAPSWVYLLNGVGLLCYMIMDNLDGKQARRLGASSPLGHLFDHGCDALNVTIAGLTMVATIRLKSGDVDGDVGWRSLLSYWLVWTMGQFVCYMATLEEFFTGSMILRQINGPNEGILLIVGFLIITGVLGTEVWDLRFGGKLFRINGGKGLMLKHWLCLFPIPLVVPTSFLNLYEVWKNGHRQKNRSGWKDLMTSVSYSFNFIVLSLAVFSWMYVTPNSFRAKTMLLVWLSGACFFHIVSRLILAHLTGIKFPVFLKMLVPLCLGAGNAVVGWWVKREPFIDDQVVFWCVYSVTMVFNAWRLYCMVTQICHYLGIRCFSIKKLYED